MLFVRLLAVDHQPLNVPQEVEQGLTLAPPRLFVLDEFVCIQSDLVQFTSGRQDERCVRRLEPVSQRTAWMRQCERGDAHFIEKNALLVSRNINWACIAASGRQLASRST